MQPCRRHVYTSMTARDNNNASDTSCLSPHGLQPWLGQMLAEWLTDSCRWTWTMDRGPDAARRSPSAAAPRMAAATSCGAWRPASS